MKWCYFIWPSFLTAHSMLSPIVACSPSATPYTLYRTLQNLPSPCYNLHNVCHAYTTMPRLTQPLPCLTHPSDMLCKPSPAQFLSSAIPVHSPPSAAAPGNIAYITQTVLNLNEDLHILFHTALHWQPMLYWFSASLCYCLVVHGLGYICTSLAIPYNIWSAQPFPKALCTVNLLYCSF